MWITPITIAAFILKEFMIAKSLFVRLQPPSNPNYGVQLVMKDLPLMQLFE